MSKQTFAVKALVFAVAVSAASVTHAAPLDNTFAEIYSSVAAVSTQQAQVVLYQPVTSGVTANVYVDNEFHTALVPGGYTAFCVAPGQRVLGAYANEAPKYSGKNATSAPSNLEAGKTYYMRVNQRGAGAPQMVAAKQAQQELADTRLQSHALSRAAAVQACDYQPMAKEFVLSSDLLFGFGQSGISAQGQQAVRDLVSQIPNAQNARVQVIGHTDVIGSQAGNQALGLRRAQSVRNLLVDAGLPGSSISTASQGSSEPVSAGCGTLSKRQKIACYAPDRRVAVRVNGQ